MDSWILSLLIFIPVIGSVAMLMASNSIGKENKNIYKIIALIATGLQLILAAILYINFDPSLGIEESKDLIEDIEQALKSLHKSNG